ncbi:N-benzyl-3-pyrrolidinol dehydrogenase [Rhizodiscina lignyota]|uniref:N-benzyl-3-pyrrolidinol dehydrogenase n=1 Tax=Rhizodiscina lignyota TaxID=1504668 RepID=A0A9P4IAD3_9PEZI|nr:N-benzyl-3-pyrrolidinol dehydrogenase [Rhizodiscina lignyota]
MYAWRKHNGNTKPLWDEVPVPSVPPNGYLVKVLAAGVCHSDFLLLAMEKHSPGFQDVYTLGHEGCGEVVGVGNQVNGERLKIGTKVAVYAVPGCGSIDCPQCSRGFDQLCMQGETYGLGNDGSFTSYIAAHARAVVPLPEGIPLAVGAVATDAVLTAYHAVVRRANVKKGDVVFLFGLGGLGLNALQIMLSLGARVIVSDVRQSTLDEAMRLGVAKEDAVPIGTTAQDFVKERGLGEKIDIVADFVGQEQTFNDAQMLVRMGGTILSVGILSPKTQNLNPLCSRKRLSVLYSYGGQRQDLVEALGMIARGQLQPQVEMGKLEDFPKMLEKLHAGEIKSRIALVPSTARSEGEEGLLRV